MNLWIYQVDKKLVGKELQSIREELQVFIDRWNAHGKKLKAAYELPYDHFIVLKVDEEEAKASGCSIDDSVRLLKTIEQKYQLQLFDRMKMGYLKDKEVQLVPLNGITALYESGTIGPDTLVFNNAISDQTDYPSQWEIPFGKSPYFNFVH